MTNSSTPGVCSHGSLKIIKALMKEKLSKPLEHYAMQVIHSKPANATKF
jgi:hypothetical protein